MIWGKREVRLIIEPSIMSCDAERSRLKLLLVTILHCVILPIFGLAVLWGCNGSQSVVSSETDAGVQLAAVETQVAQSGPDSEEIARTYEELTLITKEPVLVDIQLALLCRGVSQQDVDKARQRAGPHAHTSVRIFMNEVAAGAFRDKTAKYPVGSVIVKEKQGLEYDNHRDDRVAGQKVPRTSDGVGGMIKRAAGYDPEHGDWEYFYFEDPTKVEHGKIASCVECHRGASATDYVFGGWAVAK